ncbi:hypothetical protein TBLA_0F00655 [Henningerozyma blattae CBS 6284]|uniref:Reverse transcriptase domain-containing protein n=1 Tax=Henningerozyma blattae (strain ATCC 34711 / CBS 6284 / DSM 70876 / NBRC 10599 / NRRL Y-10934 / UCD 77-7) TaxID=1071380 RepID=I2H5F7_HENB6|nr:hypothetical protein TBLA_0F00655 [Tetrapisispora blattae CBS 6284]CCH61609.1 hypothetical protein TBLA_0F00655 [Tetrapisispora blattae CBS 6284]
MANIDSQHPSVYPDSDTPINHDSAIPTIVDHSHPVVPIFSAELTPLVGPRLEPCCLVNNVPVTVLFDSGSPTSFVSASLVAKHHWPTYSVTPFKWKGALPGSAQSTLATTCSIQVQDQLLKVAAYVAPELTDRVMIGWPIMKDHLDLVCPSESLSIAVDCLHEGTIPDYYGSELAEVFVLTLDSTLVSDSFTLLPADIRQDFATTVTDTLPPNAGTKSYSHEIILKEGGRPPRLAPYRLTPKLEKECRQIVEDLLKNQFISESKSPYSSPVLLVKKKDGSFRMVVDFRELNKVTVKDPFPLPRIDDLLSKLGDCALFTTLYLHSGYHQIPLDPDSEEMTGFTTPFGHY